MGSTQRRTIERSPTTPITFSCGSTLQQSKPTGGGLVEHGTNNGRSTTESRKESERQHEAAASSSPLALPASFPAAALAAQAGGGSTSAVAEAKGNGGRPASGRPRGLGVEQRATPIAIATRFDL